MERIRHGVWLLVAALLLGGCGEPRYWYKADAALDQAARDCQTCYEQTRVDNNLALIDASRDARITGTPFIPDVENHFQENWAEDAPERCLKARGYRKVPRSELPRGVRIRWHDGGLFTESYGLAGR